MRQTAMVWFTSWRPQIHYTPPPEMLSLQCLNHHPPPPQRLGYTCGLADITPPISPFLEEVQWRHSASNTVVSSVYVVYWTNGCVEKQKSCAAVSSWVAILDRVSSCRAGRLSQQAGNILQLVLAVQPQGWSKSLEGLTGLHFCPSLAAANVLNSTQLKKKTSNNLCSTTISLWLHVGPTKLVFCLLHKSYSR